MIAKLSFPGLILMAIAAGMSIAEASAQPAECHGDYGRLAGDTVAAALGLSNDQRAAVASIIEQRDALLSSAVETDRQRIHAKAQQTLATVLTDEQHRQFNNPGLRFSFRSQKWPDVLDWLAEEAGLSLVMDEPPPETFNYTDSPAIHDQRSDRFDQRLVAHKGLHPDTPRQTAHVREAVAGTSGRRYSSHHARRAGGRWTFRFCQCTDTA